MYVFGVWCVDEVGEYFVGYDGDVVLCVVFVECL